MKPPSQKQKKLDLLPHTHVVRGEETTIPDEAPCGEDRAHTALVAPIQVTEHLVERCVLANPGKAPGHDTFIVGLLEAAWPWILELVLQDYKASVEYDTSQHAISWQG